MVTGAYSPSTQVPEPGVKLLGCGASSRPVRATEQGPVTSSSLISLTHTQVIYIVKAPWLFLIGVTIRLWWLKVWKALSLVHQC